jgi:hypothetical protein
MDNTVILTALHQIESGLEEIMQKSYPLCKESDPKISSELSKINNTAFELKRKAVLLKNQITIL